MRPEDVAYWKECMQVAIHKQNLANKIYWAKITQQNFKGKFLKGKNLFNKISLGKKLKGKIYCRKFMQ